jgi:hypothetical protein
MSLLTELAALRAAGCYKDFAPTELNRLSAQFESSSLCGYGVSLFRGYAVSSLVPFNLVLIAVQHLPVRDADI